MTESTPKTPKGATDMWSTARAKGGYNHHAVKTELLASDGRTARAACGFRPSSPTTSRRNMRPRHGWVVQKQDPVQACLKCLSLAPGAWPQAVKVLKRQAEQASFAGTRHAAAVALESLTGERREHSDA